MDTTYMKEWTATVSRKDVYFEIDSLSHYYAEASGGENLVRDNRVATETASGGQKRIIKRLCDHRASDLRVALARFIKPISPTATASDALVDADWSFNLCVPTEAEDNTLATLTDLMHDYIVNGSLQDYYAEIGVNGNRESLQARANAALSSIFEIIYFRPMP